MTQTSATSRWSYTGNAVTTTFAYTTRIFATTDLDVYLDGVLQASGYSVTGTGSNSGGNVVFSSAPGSGVVVVIVRDVPYTQETDLLDAGPAPMATIEDMVDKTTILTQQASDLIARSIRQPEADTTAIGRLPVKASRLGKALGFDANGDPVVSTISLADLNGLSSAATAAAASAAAAATAETNAETAETNAEAAQAAAEAVQSNLALPTAVANTYLRRNAGNTAYEAKTPAEVLTDIGAQASDADLSAIAGLAGVRGDIIYRDATQWQRLAKGTSGQVLTMGANDPAWSASATSAPTVQIFTSGSGTYTTPANCTAILVRAVAGGGGGAGAGASTAPAGSTGGTTTFNSVNAVGGTGGASNNGAGGAGGSGGTGTATLRVSGTAGGGGFANGGNGTNGCGGNAPFFSGGAPAVYTQTATGISGIANTGGGGAGAGGTSGVFGAGGGGGSGEYMEIVISSPSATYSYSVGAGGAGGIGTGSGAATGGAGGSGRIIVTEYY